MRTIAYSALIAFVALPALVAAPVPPDAPRSTFGAYGLLTSSDLDRVKFDSRIVKEKEREGEKLPRERQPKSYDVAVHLPASRFREGEPIPAYYVVKNRLDDKLGLDMRLNFTGDTPHFMGSCSYDLRDRATGKTVHDSVLVSTYRDGGHLAVIPSHGYYVAKNDLSRVGEKSLPPGDYEADFTYLERRSAAVRFTVVPNPIPVKRAERVHIQNRFFTVTADDDEEPGDGDGDSFLWKDVDLSEVDAERMAPALAVGAHGVYVPDVRAIPSADGLLEARASFRSHADGDRLIISLLSRNPDKEVGFKKVPHLFLQVESIGERTRNREGRERKELSKRALQEEPSFGTPMTIEVRLPKAWRKDVGVEHECRLAVLITPDELEFPRGGGMVKDIQEVRKMQQAEIGPINDKPIWSGVLRTAFSPLSAMK